MTRAMAELMEMVWDYYDTHPGGGSLHIVLDDGNIERDNVRWCRDEAVKDGDVEGEALANRLLEVSERQRSYAERHCYDRIKGKIV